MTRVLPIFYQGSALDVRKALNASAEHLAKWEIDLARAAYQRARDAYESSRMNLPDHHGSIAAVEAFAMTAVQNEGDWEQVTAAVAAARAGDDEGAWRLFHGREQTLKMLPDGTEVFDSAVSMTWPEEADRFLTTLTWILEGWAHALGARHGPEIRRVDDDRVTVRFDCFPLRSILEMQHIGTTTALRLRNSKGVYDEDRQIWVPRSRRTPLSSYRRRRKFARGPP